MTARPTEALVPRLMRVVRRLGPADQQKVLDFAQSLQATPEAPAAGNGPGDSLLGSFADLGTGPTPEDIAEARKEL